MGGIRRIRGALALGAALLAAAALQTASANDKARHGISVFGDLKYGPGFKHFDYVNPDAPKGGTFRTWGLDSFDNLNPFILKGVEPQGIALTFDSLMVRALGRTRCALRLGRGKR